jgi:hypothetical protein
LVFTVYLEHLGAAEEPFATGLTCTIVPGDLSGQGCEFDFPVEVHQLDLMSVNVINDGCPSTQVSAVVGFASGSGELPE